MARGRGRRDTLDIANGTLPGLAELGLRPLPARFVEDRRADQVEVSPLPLTRHGKVARVVPAPLVKPFAKKARRFAAFNQMAFERPRDVLVCVRRAQRKEVLHAKGKAGGKVKPPRRGPWSSFHCRRN